MKIRHFHHSWRFGPSRLPVRLVFEATRAAPLGTFVT